jgi:hypothetical protein
MDCDARLIWVDHYPRIQYGLAAHGKRVAPEMGVVVVQRMSMIAIRSRGYVAVARHVDPWLLCRSRSRTNPRDRQPSRRAIGGDVWMRRRTLLGNLSISVDLAGPRSTRAAEVDETVGRFATCGRRAPAPLAGGDADKRAASVDMCRSHVHSIGSGKRSACE